METSIVYNAIDDTYYVYYREDYYYDSQDPLKALKFFFKAIEEAKEFVK